MDTGTGWWRFWEFSFVVACGSFAVIAAIVAVRGVLDLRRLIDFLKHKHQS